MTPGEPGSLGLETGGSFIGAGPEKESWGMTLDQRKIPVKEATPISRTAASIN
jgi:hypothetical protein